MPENQFHVEMIVDKNWIFSEMIIMLIANCTTFTYPVFVQSCHIEMTQLLKSKK
jgi:hypothetical protein